MSEPRYEDFEDPKDYFTARCDWLEKARKRDGERDLRNLKRFRKLQARVREAIADEKRDAAAREELQARVKELEGWQEEAFRDVIHAKARVRELERKLDASTRISKSMAKVLDDEHSARLEVTSVLRGRNKALEAQARELEHKRDRLENELEITEHQRDTLEARADKLQAVADEAVVPTGVQPKDYHCRICGWEGSGPALTHKRNCPVAALKEKT